MRIPTTAVLGVLVAVCALDVPPAKPLRARHGPRASSGRQVEHRHHSRTQDYDSVTDLLTDVLDLGFRLRCNITVRDAMTVSCRAQIARPRGTT